MSRAKKKTYHHGDLRRTLLTASQKLIEKVGVDALSLREVAREAEVSPAAPYHHFPSKAALLGAIAADGFDAFSAASQAAVDGLKNPDEPFARLAALGNAYIDFARLHPTEFRLMFGPSARAGNLPEGFDPSAAFELLLDAVQRVTAVLPPGLIAREAMTLTAWSIVHGAALLMLDGVISGDTEALPIKPEQIGKTAISTLMTLMKAATKR